MEVMGEVFKIADEVAECSLPGAHPTPVPAGHKEGLVSDSRKKKARQANGRTSYVIGEGSLVRFLT
jgi:hypothetical protein